MIQVMVGKPGVGKTYSLCRRAYIDLKNGIDVYSNVFMNFKGMKFPKNKKHGKLKFWKNIDDIYNLEAGSIIIDEVQIYLNARRWKNMDVQTEYKLQQHRKDGLNIYGAAQSLKRVDTVFRELVNSVLTVKKFGRLFIAKEWDPDDLDKARAHSLNTHFYFFDKRLANCYDTLRKIPY